MGRISKLKELIESDRFKGNQAKFARSVGRSPAQIWSYLNERRNIGEDFVRDVEKRLRLPYLWFDNEGDSNVGDGPIIAGEVPLISWVQAGEYAEVIDNLSPGEGERIATTINVKRHTYALRVEGDSMEPEFPAGTIIIVEPDMEPRPGDFVIVRTEDNSATFKQLILDGADYYLKPLNSRYPIKPVPETAVFCGVIRTAEKRYR